MAVYKNDANLQGLWLLEETSGTRYDDTANNNDLTDVNTVGYSSDRKEGVYSADFERSNSEYLNIDDGDQTGLDITGDLSIVAWIKPESLSDATGHAFVSKYFTGTADRSYIFWTYKIGSDYYVRCNLSSNGSGSTAATGATALSAGTWYHIGVVYNGTDIRVYVDGSLDTNGASNPATYSSGIHSGIAPFRLGVHGGSIWLYDGLMDEVAIFDRALSAAEISSIYTDGIRGAGGALFMNDYRRRRG
jgi:hypothetical protein